MMSLGRILKFNEVFDHMSFDQIIILLARKIHSHIKLYSLSYQFIKVIRMVERECSTLKPMGTPRSSKRLYPPTIESSVYLTLTSPFPNKHIMLCFHHRAFLQCLQHQRQLQLEQHLQQCFQPFQQFRLPLPIL